MRIRSDEAIDGRRILSEGPWDAYSVVGVTPGDSFARTGQRLTSRSSRAVPAGHEPTLQIVASPGAPGTHRFTFTPDAVRGRRLIGDGHEEAPVLGIEVEVTRCRSPMGPAAPGGCTCRGGTTPRIVGRESPRRDCPCSTQSRPSIRATAWCWPT